jgi:hypothetical protein
VKHRTLVQPILASEFSVGQPKGVDAAHADFGFRWFAAEEIRKHAVDCPEQTAVSVHFEAQHLTHSRIARDEGGHRAALIGLKDLSVGGADEDAARYRIVGDSL